MSYIYRGKKSLKPKLSLHYERIRNKKAALKRKKCTACEIYKSRDDFQKRTIAFDGLRPECKNCVAVFSKEYYSRPEVIEKERKRGAAYRAIPKNRIKQSIRTRDWRLKQRYGLSAKEVDQMRSEQGFRCFICKIPEHRLRRNLVVDHSHENGTVRKLLCDLCNHGLGCFKDNPKLLTEATRYLRITCRKYIY